MCISTSETPQASVDRTLKLTAEEGEENDETHAAMYDLHSEVCVN